jgi:translation initiation factor IF-2
LNESAQGKHKGRGHEQAGPPPASGAAPDEVRGGKQKGQGAFAQPGSPPSGGGIPGETRGGKQKGQGAHAQPGGAPGGGQPAGGGQEKPKDKKKKGEKASPTPPGPQ